MIYKEGKNNQNADAISRIPYPPSPETKDTPDLYSEDTPCPIVSSFTEKCTPNEDKVEKPTGHLTEIRFDYDSEQPIVASLNENRLNDLSNVAKLQRECSELADLIEFLENNSLPKDHKKARKNYI